MNELTLRPAVAGDAMPLAALEATAAAYPWSALQYRDSIAAGHTVSVAQLDGATVGAAVWMLIVDEVDLLNIFIAPAHQGRGLGRQLLQQTLDAARGAGAARMVLEVRRSNLTARQLYEHCAFRECGLRKGYYRNGREREDALLMELSL